MTRKIFRRPTTEPDTAPPVDSDTPIWDALLAEHNRSGSPGDLFADVDLGLRPETRAWFRRHRRQLADDDPIVPAPAPQPTPHPHPHPVPDPEPVAEPSQ